MKMWLRLFTVIGALGVFLPMLVFVYISAWTLSDADVKRNAGIIRKVHYTSRLDLPMQMNKVKNLQTHIDSVCDTLGLSHSQKLTRMTLNHIIVDKRYKVLYCQVPKVACTNWRRMFITLSGKVSYNESVSMKARDVHGKYDKHLTYLSDLSDEEIDVALKTYFKFVVVRQPFERLLSAYRNKFQSQINPSKFFHWRYGQDIIKKYRKNPSAKSVEKGNDVSFFEFVQYVVDEHRKEAMNEHWIQYYQLCLPCLIRYSFIGKFDQMAKDSRFILDSIGASSLVQFPTRNNSYHHQKTKDVLHQYYRQIPPQYLAKLWRTYLPDFQLFNYTVPSAISNLTSQWSTW